MELPAQSLKAVERPLPTKGTWRLECGSGHQAVHGQMPEMKARKINYAPDSDALPCPHVSAAFVDRPAAVEDDKKERNAWQCCVITTLSDLAIIITFACVGDFPRDSDPALADPGATGLKSAGRRQTARTGQPPFQCSGSPTASCRGGCFQEPSEVALSLSRYFLSSSLPPFHGR